MSADLDRVLDRIAELVKAQKEVLPDNVVWQRRPRPGGFWSLEFIAPIAVEGVIRDGLQARLSCRSDLPEQDVHAQLQVHVAAIAADAHVQRVDWRPTAPHTNPGTAPSKLRFITLHDRCYDFGVNRRLGIGALRQTVPMIAQPLHWEPKTFSQLMEFLQDMWNASGLLQIPIPPWEERLV